MYVHKTWIISNDLFNPHVVFGSLYIIQLKMSQKDYAKNVL